MAIYRVHTTKNYTVISNTHLRDKKMSLKAKGLLSVMLALPENWNYTVNGLAAICKESNTAVESSLKELKVLGYLIVTKKMPNETQSGRIEYEYDIYETPQDKQILPNEKQGVEKQGVEKQGVENNPQLNTYKLSTNKSSTNKSITNNEASPFAEFDENVKKALDNFSEMRKRLKKPLTENAKVRLAKRLKELSNVPAEQVAILNQSEDKCWLDIYPLKKDGSEKSARTDGYGESIYADASKLEV